MAYRRPGIMVTQEFEDLLPALSPFNLPSCIIGPAYQVVNDDDLGDYDGGDASYTYAGLNAGNTVDVAEFDENELADNQFPVAVSLLDAKIVQSPVVETGASGATLVDFNDASTNVFGTLVAGDEIEVLEQEVEIVSAKTNGQASNAQTSTLISPTSGEFANVKAGDVVEISSGTDVTPGSYVVQSKTDDQTLVLDSAFYTGGGSSTNIAYLISRMTGVNNQGVYKIRTVTDSNNLKLSTPLVEAESPLAYRVLRSVDEIELVRGSHFDADEATVDLFAALQLEGKDIIEGTVSASYRALRIDLANSVREFGALSDIQAVFGLDQVVPANPLAFGLSIALQNTVTAVNGLGLGALLTTNETQAYQAALDVLRKTSMYALCPLTQAPVVHQLFSTHVTQLSMPSRGLERVAILNRKIIEEETVVDDSLTDGNRTIINTQTDGIVSLGASTLTVPNDLFEDVQVGDEVVIVSGTGVTPGVYKVVSNDSDTQLTLGARVDDSGTFVASYNGANVVFFVRRQDGIEANGVIFYDGNKTFIESDVAAGHFLVLSSGSFAGRYKILSVDSNNQLTLEQVPGIAEVQSSLSYSIDKDLTNTEIAQFLSGYAGSFANRRLVMTFPDTVKIPEGSQLRELPGFYLGCSVAALTTGLPTQQGFTNLTVSGYLGFVNGSERFDEDQLDIIADGGNMIFDQEVEEAPLFIRHQLTTDRSAIKFQEYSVTKNVDYIAKFLRDAFKQYIGKYNIVDSTLDELKSTSQAVIRFLKEKTVLDAIGGVIRNGTLVKLEEGVNIDTVDMRFKFDIPIPLNNIDITIQV